MRQVWLKNDPEMCYWPSSHTEESVRKSPHLTRGIVNCIIVYNWLNCIKLFGHYSKKLYWLESKYSWEIDPYMFLQNYNVIVERMTYHGWCKTDETFYSLPALIYKSMQNSQSFSMFLFCRVCFNVCHHVFQHYLV